MDVTSEKLILSSLVQDEDYVRQVLPFLQSEYFHDKVERAVFETIHSYLQEYNTLPNRTTLLVDIRNHEKLNEKEIEEAEVIVRDIFTIDRPTDIKWLIKQTEEFCQSKAVYNAIMKAIAIYDGTEKTLTPHAIPDMIKEAVGISFDSRIGMDMYDDAGVRYDYYTLPESKVPFDIEILNEVTNGGVGRKTLNVVVAGVNVGKTLSLVHLACAYARAGLNVLYFTMEMREEEILKRMDANMLKTPINRLEELGRDTFIDKVEKIRAKSYGKIKVKEYPPGVAHVGHFKHIINELKMKQRFVPDIIIVDYIGITASSRMKLGQQTSYFYLKAVAEELRALAVETNTVLWTAMQLTRSGITNTDVEITDVSESMGIPATADFMISVTRTEELDNLGQVLFKQLKNRYGNKTNKLRFVVGIDFDKQTLYDVNQSEQEDIVVSQKISSANVTDLREKFKRLNG
jgi:KaiC/GvpD/RAD55 family RecA-like ATPase